MSDSQSPRNEVGLQPAVPERPAARPRWWLLGVIVLMFAGVYVAIWNWYGTTDGDRIIATYLAGAANLATVVVWLLALSRLSARAKAWSLGVPAAALGVFVALVRIERMNGNFVPVFGWRLARKPHVALRSQPHAPAESIALAHSPRDYPQFLGPRRNATLPGPRLQRDWDEHPPKLLWKRDDLGAGFSAFAVVGDYAFTQEMRGPQHREFVTCYHVRTGEEVWASPFTDENSPGFLSVIGGDGPRATPTVEGNRVYAYSSMGVLACFDATTSQRLWSYDVLRQHGAENSKWGRAASPLVVGPLVVVTGGGGAGPRVLALAKQTGGLVWSAGDDGGAADCYSSPALVRLCGQEQIVCLDDGGISGYEPATGRELWRQPWPWPGAEHPKVAQPVLLGDDRILVSSDYTSGVAVFQVRRDEQGQFHTQMAWKNNLMKTKFSTVVVRDGYIYGLHGGYLQCLDPVNQRHAWRKDRRAHYGHGQILLVDDCILVQAESGEVALVEATPSTFREWGRLAALQGQTWNNPALAGNLLLVRNHQQAACYALPLASP